MICLLQTGGGYLLFFTLNSENATLYEQRDPDNPKLRRESDELFLKDPIPALHIQLVRNCVTVLLRYWSKNIFMYVFFILHRHKLSLFVGKLLEELLNFGMS